MIERLDNNSTYFGLLENMFSNTFTQDKVKFDIENNSFTQYYVYKDNDKVVAFINYQIMYLMYLHLRIVASKRENLL